MSYLIGLLGILVIVASINWLERDDRSNLTAAPERSAHNERDAWVETQRERQAYDDHIRAIVDDAIAERDRYAVRP